MCKILKIIILCKIIKKHLTFQKHTVYNISTNKNFMQNNWDDGLDEFLYSQTLAGQEELADERAERDAQENEEDAE
jgi:hypothetical protein